MEEAMGQRVLKVGVGVAVAALVAVACSGGKGSQRGPAKGEALARTARVDMTEPRFTGATVHVVLVVENAKSSAVTIQRADLEVSFAGAGGNDAPGGGGGGEAGSGGDGPEETEGDGAAAAPLVFKGAMQPSGKAEVAPGGSAELPVEMEFTYPTDTAAFLAFTKSSIQKLKVVGSVQTSAGTLQVNDETDFPTPKLLVGQVKDAQMASIDDGAAGQVELEMVLHNPNPFPVKADKWVMTITVADKQLKEFEVAQRETVAPNAGVGYSESFKIDKENWGPDYKTILKKAVIPYSVVGSIQVGGVSWPQEAKGEMKFHR